MSQDIWTRNCPECGGEIEYTNKRSLWYANKNNSKCRPCYSVDIKNTLEEKYASGEIEHISRGSKDPKKEKYFRECPDCGKTQGYTTKWRRDKAGEDGTVCISCSNYKYNKTFKDVITEEHIKKMRATKAGYDSWEEYLEKYPEKKQYKAEVWKYTYQQDLESLNHWEKRGRCGVDGAYQLDHIVSIEEGYQREIPAEEVGHIDNLRMIPWKTNREKW